MSVLRSIFTSGYMKDQVNGTHESCVWHVVDYADNCQVTPTLFSVLSQCNGSNATVNTSAAINSVWTSALSSGKMPMFRRLGVYNLPAISQKEAAFRFLLSVQNEPFYQAIFKTDPTVDELVEISKYMKSPSTLLSLKHFYLYLNRQDKKKYPMKGYVGEPAMTSPTQLTCKRLWGTAKTGAEAKILHEELSRETGRSQLYVNTVLWRLGTCE